MAQGQTVSPQCVCVMSIETLGWIFNYNLGIWLIRTSDKDDSLCDLWPVSWIRFHVWSGCRKSSTIGTVKTCLVSSVDTKKLDRNGVGKGSTWKQRKETGILQCHRHGHYTHSTQHICLCRQSALALSHWHVLSSSHCLSSSSSMNVACNDVIWLIFQSIPLNELLPLRLVCVRWNSIIRKFLSTKKTLLLCSHDTDPFQLQSVQSLTTSTTGKAEQSLETLFIGDDTCGLVPDLASLCPNVSKLLVVDDFCQPKLGRTSHFVSSWTDTLTSLTLQGLSFSSTNLAESLNSLLSLTELHLLYIYDRIDLDKVQIFPQLTRLSVVRYYGDIESVLCRLGSHCTRLLLDKVVLTFDQLNTVVEKNADFCAHLQHLSIGPLCVTEQSDLQPTLSIICSTFKAVQYLYVDFAFQVSALFSVSICMLCSSCSTYHPLTNRKPCHVSVQLPVEEIIFNLALLPHLNELKLTIDCEVVEENQLRYKRASCSRQLRSVRKLNLNLLHSPVDIDHFASTLVLTFPSVQQVKVRSHQRSLITQLERSWPLCTAAELLPNFWASWALIKGRCVTDILSNSIDFTFVLSIIHN